MSELFEGLEVSIKNWFIQYCINFDELKNERGVTQKRR